MSSEGSGAFTYACTESVPQFVKDKAKHDLFAVGQRITYIIGHKVFDAIKTGDNRIFISELPMPEIREDLSGSPSFYADLDVNDGDTILHFNPRSDITPLELAWMMVFTHGLKAQWGDIPDWKPGTLTEWLAEHNLLRHFEVT